MVHCIFTQEKVAQAKVAQAKVAQAKVAQAKPTRSRSKMTQPAPVDPDNASCLEDDDLMTSSFQRFCAVLSDHESNNISFGDMGILSDIAMESDNVVSSDVPSEQYNDGAEDDAEDEASAAICVGGEAPDNYSYEPMSTTNDIAKKEPSLQRNRWIRVPTGLSLALARDVLDGLLQKESKKVRKNQCTRNIRCTKPNGHQYNCNSGPGSGTAQLCRKCKVPRKGHRCPFKKKECNVPLCPKVDF